MRDHSTRKYNKSKITRFRTKSSQRVNRPQKIQRLKASLLPQKRYE